ncbi:PD-(D/E)XK nuclease family protein [Cupriavidus pinatubonensis]|uniref:PD-(D/E)XK nuclease family protein n=1 Tax=Cupriavidus pinatubonensis TaxID=248026 RepID=UPI001C72B545|nr:PD-(D/E)XK nuclease family protein [Cupriavidus pinatubonensis]QYY30429.1 PD-(D/E)XK nuclease family protein [Cupriavidus pinatubonensis]
MTPLRFRPGPDFLDQAAAAAWFFLDRCGVSEAGAHVIVPTAAQIPGVRMALDAAARAAGQPRLLPRVLTLGHWLLDLPPEGAPVRSHAARLLAVQQAVRAQDWLRRSFGAQTESAAWGLAQTLLSICDELNTRWLEDVAVSDGEAMDGTDRAALLQGALERTYAHLSERMLGEESRIVLAFWQALSGPDDPLPSRRRALRRLAQQLSGPVVWIAPTPPTPIEGAFLRDADELVPVLEIGYDWSGAAEAQEPGWYDTLISLWPEARISDAADAPAFTPALPTLPEARPAIRVIGTARFEDEAAAAADQLVQWLNAGRRNIALVAHDRVVARRVRALLARAGAPVRDETGWKLSTTRAAAALMRWFDLLVRDGDTAALLDLLKSPFCLPDFPDRGAAIALIERQVRRDNVSGGWDRLRHLPRALPAALADADADDTEIKRAEAVRRSAGELLTILADEAARWPRGLAQHPLSMWLGCLDGTLDALGMRAALAADEAGRQLLDALARLQDLPSDETSSHATLSQAEFRAMLSALLESVAYKEPSAASAARITILPLNGARMRRFDGVVVVGCDDAQLPSSAAELMFFSNQMRRELQLEDRESRFAQQARDLAEVLLNNDDVVLTWQRLGGRGEPKHVSGWIERLSACCARAGVAIEASMAPLVHQTFAETQGMPAPAAPQLVPARWSAQAYNMLRRCPYQFFAGRMLGLAGLDAVSDDLEKRDIGELLHRVLLRYHRELLARRERGETVPEAERLDRLREISDDVFGALMAEDGNAIGYYRRWCEVLPSYVTWQTEREAQGWFWRGGEIDAGVDLPMPDGKPIRLNGRIDRLDQGPGGAHAVLDYKTQSAARLKRKTSEVEEDCQLPFYGLLRADAVGGSWVALEGVRDGAASLQREVDLPDFDAAVAWLERQLRDDVMRLREGARLPAFGDASACMYCSARGLCRKGFWESTAVPALTT